MELTIYDRELHALGIVDAIESLVWTRRYKTMGDMALQVPYRAEHEELLREGNLVLKRGGAEAMQITYVHIAKNNRGKEQIEVQGHTLHLWMGLRLLLKQITTTDENMMMAQQIVAKMIRDNIVEPTDTARKIPLTALTVQEDSGGEPIADYQSEEHVIVQDAVEALLADSELGLKVLTDPTGKQHSFYIFKGADLTTGQSERTPCIFAMEYETLGEQAYTHSTDNYKTTAYVYGDNEDMNTGDVIVGAEKTGLDRREVVVEATDISIQTTDDNGNEITMQTSQFNALLEQRGKEELKLYLEEQTFEGTLNQYGQTRYGTDYDIGDRVTCIAKRWGKSVDVTINEITEAYQGNKVKITAIFGDGTPSLKQKIKQIIR